LSLTRAINLIFCLSKTYHSLFMSYKCAISQAGCYRAYLTYLIQSFVREEAYKIFVKKHI